MFGVTYRVLSTSNSIYTFALVTIYTIPVLIKGKAIGTAAALSCYQYIHDLN